MTETLTKRVTDDELALTTVQIRKATSRKLAQLAKAYRRSKTEQVAFMVDIEVAKLAQYKASQAGGEENPSPLTTMSQPSLKSLENAI